MAFYIWPGRMPMDACLIGCNNLHQTHSCAVHRRLLSPENRQLNSPKPRLSGFPFQTSPRPIASSGSFRRIRQVSKTIECCMHCAFLFFSFSPHSKGKCRETKKLLFKTIKNKTQKKPGEAGFDLKLKVHAKQKPSNTENAKECCQGSANALLNALPWQSRSRVQEHAAFKAMGQMTNCSRSWS